MKMKINCDVRFEVETPENGLPVEGIRVIQRYLYDKGLNYAIPYDFEWVWKTNKGTLPKRVRAAIVKEGLDCPDDVVSQVGNLAATHSEKYKLYKMDFTQNFNWDDGDFGDAGSCYWGENSGARLNMLPSMGAYAVRFYDCNGYGDARAWLVPCWGKNNEKFYILFNPYGRYTGYDMARVIAFHWGVSYKRTGLCNEGSSSGLLWINNAIGYAIGSADILPDNWDFECEEEECEEEGSAYCNNCELPLYNIEDFYYDPNGCVLCDDCYSELVRMCDVCGDNIWKENALKVYDGTVVCGRCAEKDFVECVECEKLWPKNMCFDEVCNRCHRDQEEPELEVIGEKQIRLMEPPEYRYATWDRFAYGATSATAFTWHYENWKEVYTDEAQSA
jgi:hypothetical protein